MKIILSLVVSLLFFSESMAQQEVSLEDCQEMARANYPQILQFELIEKSKEYTLSNANKAYLPQFDVTLIGGVVSGFPSFDPTGADASSSADLKMISVLQLKQTIWDGGITKARKGMIVANSEIEKADLEISLYQLEERINNLFFGVLLIDEQLKQMEVLKSTMMRNMKRVEIALVNGTAYKSDVDEIKVEGINVDQNVEELSSNRKVYIKVLGAMVGENYDQSTEFSTPIIEEGFLMSENNRPELRMFENQEELIEAKSAIDKSMLYPKIGLLGFGAFIQPGADFGTSTIDNILIGGLSLGWSLEGLYKNGNNKKLKELNLQNVSVQKETFLFNNNLELDQTRIELLKYKNLLEQDREIVNLKTSIKKAYDVKYENGISTMSELLDRTNEESVAQQNLIVHEIQYLMKAYQYKNKSGN